jgi:predicted nucleic acid-binding Zn ribbon protein
MEEQVVPPFFMEKMEENKVCIRCGNKLKHGTMFCSYKCRFEDRTQKSLEKRPRVCPQCSKMYVAKKLRQKYCSNKCLFESRKKVFYLTCMNCGVVFTENVNYQAKREKVYCSLYCAKKKFYFKEIDFTIQSADNMYWLGFLYATTIEITEECIILRDSKEILEKLNRWLNGNLIVNEKNGIHTLTLFSRKVVKHLEVVGLQNDYYREAPIMENIYIKDFIRGYFDSHNGFLYHDSKRPVVAIHGEHSKVMRWIADMLSAKLTYSNKEWVVVSFDFYSGCLGFPRNEDKWKKFNNPQATAKILPLYRLE